MTGNTIVILDFGSQYTQLITRAVRELEVYSVQLPWDSSFESIEALDPIGIILSGGPDSIYNADAPRIQSALLDPELYSLKSEKCLSRIRLR